MSTARKRTGFKVWELPACPYLKKRKRLPLATLVWQRGDRIMLLVNGVLPKRFLRRVREAFHASKVQEGAIS